jgi:hypothetical protein
VCVYSNRVAAEVLSYENRDHPVHVQSPQPRHFTDGSHLARFSKDSTRLVTIGTHHRGDSEEFVRENVLYFVFHSVSTTLCLK